jgi:hypothetical protein
MTDAQLSVCSILSRISIAQLDSGSASYCHAYDNEGSRILALLSTNKAFVFRSWHCTCAGLDMTNNILRSIGDQIHYFIQ